MVRGARLQKDQLRATHPSQGIPSDHPTGTILPPPGDIPRIPVSQIVVLGSYWLVLWIEGHREGEGGGGKREREKMRVSDAVLIVRTEALLYAYVLGVKKW